VKEATRALCNGGDEETPKGECVEFMPKKK
jgi:hypothetical protein